MTTGGCVDNMLLNLNLTTTTTVVHYDIELGSASTAPQNKHILYISFYIYQTFQNTTAILQ